jgi:NAD(P)-dependent dehydrogenase (short-subunit alcohol dehydrogenase family)
MVELKMTYDLSGKTALVTGSSRGIGAAAALSLASAGAHVIAHYSSFAQGAIDNLSSIPDSRKTFIQEDLAVAGSGRVLWQKALAVVPKIDIFVNNAAVNIETPFEATAEIWDNGWADTFAVNVFEAANIMKEAVEHFRKINGGVIISMSSWSGQRGSALPTLPAYAASKAAVKALTQTIAKNFAKEGVLAYIISPGIVKTRMSDLAAVVRGGEEAMKSQLVMGELVKPEELGELIVFLSSGACRHLTGSTIDVNGASYIR